MEAKERRERIEFVEISVKVLSLMVAVVSLGFTIYQGIEKGASSGAINPLNTKGDFTYTKEKKEGTKVDDTTNMYFLVIKPDMLNETIQKERFVSLQEVNLEEVKNFDLYILCVRKN